MYSIIIKIKKNKILFAKQKSYKNITLNTI